MFVIVKNKAEGCATLSAGVVARAAGRFFFFFCFVGIGPKTAYQTTLRRRGAALAGRTSCAELLQLSSDTIVQ